MIPTIQCYGVVVVEEQSLKFLILSQKGIRLNWSFPKGHAEKMETPKITALRELKEETGITEIILLDTPLIHEEYEVVHNNKKYLKFNDYFIGFVKNINVKIQEEEISEYVWNSYVEALNSFSSSKQQSRIEILKKAKEYIDGYEQNKSGK